jgi:hypothetical protein
MKTCTLITAALSLSLLAPLAAEAQQEAFLAADKNGDTELDSSEFKIFVDGLAASGARRERDRAAVIRVQVFMRLLLG